MTIEKHHDTIIEAANLVADACAASIACRTRVNGGSRSPLAPCAASSEYICRSFQKAVLECNVLVLDTDGTVLDCKRLS